MDVTARYLELCRLGRESFLENAAPAALVRKRSDPLRAPSQPGYPSNEDETIIAGVDSPFVGPVATGPDLVVHPLEKKPGAPFSDMITVGRTANNDVVLNDVTVSRFHAYFRGGSGGWRVCDSGSKNGTTVGGSRIEGRREIAISSGAKVVFGEVAATFYEAAELFRLLSSAK